MTRRFVSAGILAGALVALAAAPVSAATPPTDQMKNSELIASPSVVLIEYGISAFVQDNSQGLTFGDSLCSTCSGGDGSASTVPFTTGWQGTGFFVSSDGKIVTAAHVAAPTDESVKTAVVNQYIDQDAINQGICTAGDSACLASAESQYGATFLLNSRLTEQQTKITVYTQNMTSPDQGLPATLEASSPQDTGHDTAVIQVNATNTPVLQVADTSGVSVGDAVTVLGYPAVADISQTLSAALTPSETTGSVTAIKTGPQGFSNGVTVFQHDATTGPGGSGGPGIRADGSVIGLVSFGSTSTTNVGYLIAGSEVKDTMQQAGANNSLGSIDRLWRSGLSLYDNRHFKAAESDFKQCMALSAIQVGCAKYDTLATESFGKDVPVPVALTAASKSGLPTWLWAATGGAVIVVLLFAGVLLARRRPSPLAAVPAATPIPFSIAPVVAPAPPLQARAPVPSGPLAQAAGHAPPTLPKFCADCGMPMNGQAVCSHSGPASSAA